MLPVSTAAPAPASPCGTVTPKPLARLYSGDAKLLRQGAIEMPKRELRSVADWAVLFLGAFVFFSCIALAVSLNTKLKRSMRQARVVDSMSHSEDVYVDGDFLDQPLE